MGETYLRLTRNTEDGEFLIGEEHKHDRDFRREGREAFEAHGHRRMMVLLRRLNRAGKLSVGDRVFTVVSAADHNFEVAYETTIG